MNLMNMRENTARVTAREAFRIEAIATAAECMDEFSFMEAVDLLSKAGRIAAGGCGHSGIACRHFAHLMSATWNIAQKKIAGHKPFDNPLFMDMLGLVFRMLRDNLVEIDRDFILELGSLYLCLVTQLEIRKLQKDACRRKVTTMPQFFIAQFNYECIRLLGSNAHLLFHEFNISNIRGGANLPPKAVI